MRPAVCLTNTIRAHYHIILGFITSRIHPTPLDTDLVIDANAPDFPATGLHVSSTLQLHRLMTATTTLIQRELGVLPPRLQQEAADRLRKLFELL